MPARGFRLVTCEREQLASTYSTAAAFAPSVGRPLPALRQHRSAVVARPGRYCKNLRAVVQPTQLGPFPHTHAIALVWRMKFAQYS